MLWLWWRPELCDKYINKRQTAHLASGYVSRDLMSAPQPGLILRIPIIWLIGTSDKYVRHTTTVMMWVSTQQRGGSEDAGRWCWNPLRFLDNARWAGAPCSHAGDGSECVCAECWFILWCIDCSMHHRCAARPQSPISVTQSRWGC